MSKKKVVKTSQKTEKVNKKLAPTVSRSKSTVSSSQAVPNEFIFGKQNYMLMLIGIGLIALGMVLMLGGGMEDPNVWDESVIYSFRRTVLAPVVILAGLIVEVFAILK